MKWEYHIENIVHLVEKDRIERAMQVLAKLGAEGWEAIGFSPDYNGMYHVLLKRRLD